MRMLVRRHGFIGMTFLGIFLASACHRNERGGILHCQGAGAPIEEYAAHLAPRSEGGWLLTADSPTGSRLILELKASRPDGEFSTGGLRAHWLGIETSVSGSPATQLTTEAPEGRVILHQNGNRVSGTFDVYTLSVQAIDAAPVRLHGEFSVDI